MNKNKLITFIVFFDKFNLEVEKEFNNTLSNLYSQRIIVDTKGIDLTKEVFDKVANLVLVTNNEGIVDDLKKLSDNVYCQSEQSLAGLVNHVVKNLKTAYFTLFEHNDSPLKYYINQIDNLKEPVDLLLPIQIVVKDGKFVGFVNELYWSREILNDPNNDELTGVIDFEVAKKVATNNLYGAVISVDTFNTLGGFKTNLLYSYNYEFLLRLLHNKGKVKVMNKAPFMTKLNENSFIKNISNNVKREELKYWAELAQKEYMFDVSIQRPEFKYIESNLTLVTQEDETEKEYPQQ